MKASVKRGWAVFEADRYLDARMPDWAMLEASGAIRCARRDGVDIVLVDVDCRHVVRALRSSTASPTVRDEHVRARITSSSPRWEPGWPPGVVPGALLWAIGGLGFIVAVSGPLNVQALAGALLFAGRGIALLMTSEVEGR